MIKAGLNVAEVQEFVDQRCDSFYADLDSPHILGLLIVDLSAAFDQTDIPKNGCQGGPQVVGGRVDSKPSVMLSRTSFTRSSEVSPKKVCVSGVLPIALETDVGSGLVPRAVKAVTTFAYSVI